MKPMKLDIQKFATPLPVTLNINFKDISEDELPESLTFSFDGEQAIIQITGISKEYGWTSSTGGNVFNSVTIETEGYSIIAYQKGGPIDIDVYKNYSFVKKILEDNTVNTIAPDFSQAATTDEGMFSALDNNGVSCYFRGAVTNNYVKFANFWWRIVRINGDGSVRLIYQGGSATGNGQIDKGAFNTNRNDNAHVGYMYGTPGSTTYEETHANVNNSEIKTILDNWYESNLSNYTNYIDIGAGFWGDRTPYSGSGAGTTRTYYAANNRLFTNKTPSFECANNSDLYTIPGSEDGNKALQYPIGLISADEVAYAGGVYNTSNSSYYLYINDAYWTLSPSYYRGSASAFFVNSYGSLGYAYVTSGYGVRPVINLRGDLFVTGTGTSIDPYEVSLPVVPITNFNGTELTNIYYNGTEISKMYCNGVLVFEKEPSEVYKRRIMVGDDLKGMTVYNDFYSGYYNNFTKPAGGAIILPMKLVTVNYETTGMAGDLSGISYYEGSGTITINSDFLEAELYYYNWNTGVERIGGPLTYPTDKDYLVTEVYDIDKSYRHLYIEDPNIRPLQAGDILTNNTVLYFNFPDNLGIQAINSYNQEKYTEDAISCTNDFRIYGEVSGATYKIHMSIDGNNSIIYNSNFGDIKTNSSFISLELSGSFMSTEISSVNTDSILYNSDYILVDITTLGTNGGGHGH